MKLFFVALSLVVSAFAQTVDILTPTLNQTMTSGESFTVQIMKPDYIQSSTDVGIAIAISHCQQIPCEDRSEQLGVVLYAGGYDPTIPAPSQYGYSFYQNFTVIAPSMTTGPAVLSVVHSELIGAGPMPFTEVKNITVYVQ